LSQILEQREKGALTKEVSKVLVIHFKTKEIGIRRVFLAYSLYYPQLVVIMSHEWINAFYHEVVVFIAFELIKSMT